MQIDLFAGLAVRDRAEAADWYERLLGSPASFEPNENELVWTVNDHAHLYIEVRPPDAGHSMVTLFVVDLDGFLAAAKLRGLEPESRETYGNGVRKVLFHDPDGNEIGIGG
jgi:catechol 2,3-dioxygenase-like lactoylglutathione lyase family enzyme